MLNKNCQCIKYVLFCCCVEYKSGIKALPVLRPNEGLQLMAIVDHMDGDEERKSGDLWQLEGPLTYKPTPYAVCQFCANSSTAIIGLVLSPMCEAP